MVAYSFGYHCEWNCCISLLDYSLLLVLIMPFKKIQMTWYPGPWWPWRDGPYPHSGCQSIPKNSERLLCKCAFHIQLTNPNTGPLFLCSKHPRYRYQVGTTSVFQSPLKSSKLANANPDYLYSRVPSHGNYNTCSCPHFPLASSTPDWPFNSYMSPLYCYPPHDVSCPSSWGL